MKNILLILIILLVLYKLLNSCYTSEQFYDCKTDVQKCIKDNEAKDTLTAEVLTKCKALCPK